MTIRLFTSDVDAQTRETGDRFAPRFNGDGLIPAIVTESGTGEVLMFAFMNDEALAKTLETRMAHFFSRSRGRLWLKGEESGNILRVEHVLTDCDQDVVWLKVRVEGAGVACHTGAKSCFYREVDVEVPMRGPLGLKRVQRTG